MKFLLIVSLFFAHFSVSDELKIIESFIYCEKEGDYFTYKFNTIIQNIGQGEITIPTRFNSISKETNLLDGHTNFRYNISNSALDGNPIVTSESAYEPVTLRPNEVAVISQYMARSSHAVHARSKEEAKMAKIIIDTTSTTSTRYNFWQGKIYSSTIKPISSGNNTCEP